MHPYKENFHIRCWGLAKVPNFDIVSCPFVIARDNVGLTLIDVKNFKVYMFSRSPITSSLFGHGDILKLTSVN